MQTKQTNFEKLKAQFQKETNKTWDNDIATYVAYYHAKMFEVYVETYCHVNKIALV